MSDSELQAELLAELRHIAGETAVRTDSDALALVTSDLHETGTLPAAVVRPDSAEITAKCIAAATGRGYAIDYTAAPHCCLGKRGG